MQYDVTAKEKINIDILLCVAAQGGVENVVNRLGKYMIDRGFRVRVVQLIYEDFPWVLEGLDFAYIYDTRENQNLEHLYQGYKAIFEKSEHLPDVILATAWPYMNYIADRARQEMELDAVVISYLHSILSQYESAGFGGAEALSYADIHLAISDLIKKDIDKNVDGAFIYRVNNPINSDAIVASKERDPLKLAYVGRQSKEKHVEIIIEAVAKSKYPYELFLVGQGPDEGKLRKLCKRLGVEGRIHFLGWQDAPWEAVKDSYACILASEYEGFSLTSIEAVACGKAMIGTPVSGVIELVKPGENGFLFPKNDVGGLVQILDAMADGSLPFIETDACLRSALPFYEDMALGDILLKIYAASRKKLLPYQEVRLPRISVIIPCFNAASFIDRCLESILSQTIGLRALEIILINDASTDNTLEVLLAYEEKYPENIMVINCEENGKQGRARNIGMQYATGEHITFVDADDMIAPGMIEKLYLNSQTYGADIAECGIAEFFDEIPLNKANPREVFISADTTEEIQSLYLNNVVVVSPCRRLFRKEFLERCGALFPEGIFMEDLCFSQVLMTECKRLYHTDEEMYYYYQNPSSTMKSEKLKEYYMDVFYAQRLAIEEIKNRGGFETFRQALEVSMAKRMSDLYNFLNSLPRFPKENWDEIKSYIHETFPDINNNPYISPEEKAVVC